MCLSPLSCRCHLMPNSMLQFFVQTGAHLFYLAAEFAKEKITSIPINMRSNSEAALYTRLVSLPQQALCGDLAFVIYHCLDVPFVVGEIINSIEDGVLQQSDHTSQRVPELLADRECLRWKVVNFWEKVKGCCKVASGVVLVTFELINCSD
jgi:hypothetical protein